MRLDDVIHGRRDDAPSKSSSHCLMAGTLNELQEILAIQFRIGTVRSFSGTEVNSATIDLNSSPSMVSFSIKISTN